MPDETMGNIAKLNTNDGFWEMMALAGDIAGGIPAIMPSELDKSQGKFVHQKTQKF